VEGTRGGICLVNKDVVCRPKDLGGLGVHDLPHFGRALHQRWCWFHWTDENRLWHNMTIPCDEDDMALFRASTEIKLGNGKKVIFLHDKWLEGMAPIDVAPNLYKKAHFKKRTVAKELWNKN
jgi:hypothetical protein